MRQDAPNPAKPPNAAPGIYQLITKISTGYGTAQDRTDFQVD